MNLPCFGTAIEDILSCEEERFLSMRFFICLVRVFDFLNAIRFPYSLQFVVFQVKFSIRLQRVNKCHFFSFIFNSAFCLTNFTYEN